MLDVEWPLPSSTRGLPGPGLQNEPENLYWCLHIERWAIGPTIPLGPGGGRRDPLPGDQRPGTRWLFASCRHPAGQGARSRQEVPPAVLSGATRTCSAKRSDDSFVPALHSHTLQPRFTAPSLLGSLRSQVASCSRACLPSPPKQLGWPQIPCPL